MYADAPVTRLPALLDRLSAAMERLVARSRATDDIFDTDCDRRDFLLEMMEDHPHAFTSEADLQGMMHLYPGRF